MIQSPDGGGGGVGGGGSGRSVGWEVRHYQIECVIASCRMGNKLGQVMGSTKFFRSFPSYNSFSASKPFTVVDIEISCYYIITPPGSECPQDYHLSIQSVL